MDNFNWYQLDRPKMVNLIFTWPLFFSVIFNFSVWHYNLIIVFLQAEKNYITIGNFIGGVQEY